MTNSTCFGDLMCQQRDGWSVNWVVWTDIEPISLGAVSFIQYNNCMKIFQLESVKTNIFSLLDEATFAGDKKEASALKGLVLEKRRIREAKCVTVISIDSHTNLFMFSNSDQVARVEAGDRRYFCMDVWWSLCWSSNGWDCSILWSHSWKHHQPRL